MGKDLQEVPGIIEEERQMGAQEKVIQYSSPAKMKWWHWFMLISGSVMVVGGIISVIVF
jgi:hypothetical protein